jgi:hypothetical protein
MSALAAVALAAAYVFSEVSLTRVSARKDANGRYAAPYTHAEGTFQMASKAGGSVTLVPIGVPLPPVAAEIASVEKSEGCGAPAWTAKLKPVTRPDVLAAPPLAERAAEMPFDAVVVAPAAPAARAVDTKAVKPSAGVRPESIQAAIDLDSDGSADMLLVRYCIRPANAKLAECDYVRTEYWAKSGTAWRRVRQAGPC